MRMILCLVFGLISSGQLHAQPRDTLFAQFGVLSLDTLLQREKTASDPRVRFVLLSRVVMKYVYLDRQEECMTSAMRALELAETTRNDTLIGWAHYAIGAAFTIASDVNSALKHHNIAFDHFASARDSLWMGAACKEIAVLYQRVGDNDGAMSYMRKALAFGMPAGIRSRGMGMIAKCFLERGELDSALYYAQKVDMVPSPGKDPWGYTHSNGVLATVYTARRELDLAELHFKRTIAAADSFDLPYPFIQYGAGYAALLLGQGRSTEGLAMAQRALRVAERGRVPKLIAEASDVLADAYHADGMTDSAFFYAKRCIAYRDSVIVTQNRSQLKSQLFAQQLKDIEDAKLRTEEVAARSRNIQFGIIALIVITLLVFLLAISRTSVVGAKTIKNLSLVALLLLFEFINLLLSPLLGEVFDQSPLLILLAMVIIAGLLIPLHHRMERWITNMLVSKNNRVRLEAARRTIAELEGGAKEDVAN